MNGKTHSWLGLGPNTVLHAVSDENSLSKVGSSLDTVGLAEGDSSSCGFSAFGDDGADATVED